MSNTMYKPSPKLSAFLWLKINNIIESVSDATYVQCFGGDHIFKLKNGEYIAVDLVLNQAKQTNTIIQGKLYE